MRISDWSSDVCSSDLKDLLRQQSGKIPRCARDDSEEQLAHFESGCTNGTGNPSRLIPSSLFPLLAPPTAPSVRAAPRESNLDHHCARYEIGRASCRERVCQYV